jgi:DNA ligase (NAD+)
MVNQFQLKKGDVIEIVRSGEVIPKFLQVIHSSINPFEIPHCCPSCNSEVEIRDIRIYCTNQQCPGRELETYLNFVQKIGIMDLSSKRLELMINSGLLKSIGDLYRLTKEQLLGLEKTKDKLADKLLDQIEKSKSANLVTFLSALGIPGGAYNKCERVVSAGFDTIEKIRAMSVADLCVVEGFAEKSATEFVNGIQNRKKLIDDLLNVGFDPKSVSKQDQFCFCITGSLSEKRAVIEGRIRDHGHKVVSSVTNETTHLVCNQPSSSSKYKKAQKLNIPIITETDLQKIL